MRGGLRTRLILDSARMAIIAGLSELGWFEPTVHDTPPGTRHHQRLQYVPRPAKWDDQIEPNRIAISTEDIYDDEAGLGGEVDDTIEIYIDILAESDPFGWELAADVKDLLLGKMPDLGRHAPVLDVYDLRQATPAPFTTVDVQVVEIDRPEARSPNWTAHWFSVRADLLDEYLDESGDIHPVSQWDLDFAAVWHQIQLVEQGPNP